MNEHYWGNLMHLGYNMWFDENASLPKGMENTKYGRACSYLRCDQKVWDNMVGESVKNGVNMVVIDLGEGVQYETCPEIAVEGAWSIDKLRAELARLRSLGITPIPKLNFALTHNKWLGPYKRMATSDIYNKVCTNLIREVCDIFDTPPMFHLGMDEEENKNQINMQFACFRQFDLWWRDLYKLLDACDSKGVRPALWSDYANDNLDAYLTRMSKDVVQFHWYYWNYFENVSADFIELDKFDYKPNEVDGFKKFLKCFHAFDKVGFDMIPTGSIWHAESNLENLVKYCQKTISSDHILGYMQTAWAPTLPDELDKQLKAIRVVGDIRKKLD